MATLRCCLIFFLSGCFSGNSCHAQHSAGTPNPEELLATSMNKGSPDSTRVEAIIRLIEQELDSPSQTELIKKVIPVSDSLLQSEKISSEQKLELFNIMGSTMRKWSDIERAIEYHQSALVLSQEVDDKNAMGIAISALGICQMYLGDYDSAKGNLLRGLEIFKDLEVPANYNTYVGISYVYEVLGQYDSASIYIEKGLSLAQSKDDFQGSILFKINLVRLKYFQTELAQAKSLVQDILDSKEDIEDWSIITNALNLQGLIYEQEGNYQAAIEAHSGSLQLGKEHESPIHIAQSLANIGNVYFISKDYEKALDYFLESDDAFEEIAEFRSQGNILVNVGTSYHVLGNDSLALYYYQEALELKQSSSDLRGIAEILTNIGQVYFDMGEPDSAMVVLRQSEKMKRELGLFGIIPLDLYLISSILQDRSEHIEAIKLAKVGLGYAQQTETLDNILKMSEILYSSNKALGRSSAALEMYELYIETRDSLNSEENQRATIRYEYEQQALEDSLASLQIQAERELSYERELSRRNYLLFGGVGLSLLAVVFFRLRQQRNEREQALVLERERSEKLEQIDRLKDQFLANTSHELRTPLNGIIGLSEGLFEQIDDPVHRNRLGMVISSGKRLTSLVNDLLDFSRIRNADLLLQLRPVDLRSTVELVLQVSYPLVSGKSVRLHNEVSSDLPAVSADEDRLIQILHNLVGNAIKFTDEGRVEVRAELLPDRGGIRVTVMDTGIGIAPENHGQIFSAFEQADGSISRSYEGTGLGLSITRQLVEQHGGRIGVDSRIGEGSEFWFTLPVSTESLPAGEIGKSLTPLVSPLSLSVDLEGANREEIGSSGKQTRVLIVDDEPVNHEVLKTHLDRSRFLIDSAMNGAEAIRMIEESSEAYDLILLDIMMPRVSGYEVAKKIREAYLPSELPIIMVTAKNQVMDLVQGLDLGANDYLAKPFTKEEFLARVRTHLNLHQIHRATGRFVPVEFIKTLGKDNIADVRRGDSIYKELTVFFSDIRSYTTLAEQMDPSDNFRFVNAYAGRMGPVIQAHRGFVNQYLGDGIMAIFQHSPDDALRAAIGMQAKLREYNEERILAGRDPISVGMGMHTGPLIMGIIGDEKRTDHATVSDTVNTAARMESLTKTYGVQIIISQQTRDALQNPDEFVMSYLGEVAVKGKKKPVGVYQVDAGE